MTREAWKPGEARGDDEETRGISSPGRREELHGVTEGRPSRHARPGASLRRSVTAFCHGWQGKPAGGPGRAHDSRTREQESWELAVAEAREGESSIEDGKR